MEEKIKFKCTHNCVEEILVDGRSSYRSLIEKANEFLKGIDGELYEFDRDGDNGECAIMMEFFDNIAIATDKSGLWMKYPTLEEISKSPSKQREIQDYTGIHDGYITQHDVALRYGVLKYCKALQESLAKCK